MDDIHYNYYDSISKIGLQGVIEDTKKRIAELSKSDTIQSPYLYDHFHEKLEILEAMYQEKFEEE